jgi:EamA-like transporter family.
VIGGAYLGPFLALGAAASFAGASYCISRTTQSKGDKGTMFSVLMTMTMSFLLWVATGAEGLSGANPVLGVAWFVMAGLFAMVFGRSFLFVSIRTLGVARSSAVKRLNPFFSALFGLALLGETLTAFSGIGILLIAISFIFLITEKSTRGEAGVSYKLVDYLPGIVAALCYATAYISRKFGLTVMPSATLGTFVSACAGFLAFCVFAVFSKRYREKLLNMFSYLDRWIFFGAMLMSAGQILFFTALSVETLITVAMIASTEIFIAIFLASFVFRTEPVPSFRIVLAVICAMAGTILMTLA